MDPKFSRPISNDFKNDFDQMKYNHPFTRKYFNMPLQVTTAFWYIFKYVHRTGCLETFNKKSKEQLKQFLLKPKTQLKINSMNQMNKMLINWSQTLTAYVACVAI